MLETPSATEQPTDTEKPRNMLERGWDSVREFATGETREQKQKRETAERLDRKREEVTISNTQREIDGFENPEYQARKRAVAELLITRPDFTSLPKPQQEQIVAEKTAEYTKQYQADGGMAMKEFRDASSVERRAHFMKLIADNLGNLKATGFSTSEQQMKRLKEAELTMMGYTDTFERIFARTSREGRQLDGEIKIYWDEVGVGVARKHLAQKQAEAKVAVRAQMSEPERAVDTISDIFKQHGFWGGLFVLFSSMFKDREGGNLFAKFSDKPENKPMAKADEAITTKPKTNFKPETTKPGYGQEISATLAKESISEDIKFNSKNPTPVTAEHREKLGRALPILKLMSRHEGPFIAMKDEAYSFRYGDEVALTRLMTAVEPATNQAKLNKFASDYTAKTNPPTFRGFLESLKMVEV